FDLGRVVIDIDFSKAVACWAGHAGCEPSDILKRFVPDEGYRHHETGKISDADYFGSLRASLDITISDAQFLEGWNAIFAGLMPVADALAAVLAGAEPLPEEMVALDAAYHRVLARDIAALRTQPPEPMSAMDGYAVRSTDAARSGSRLKVIGEVAAGRPFEGI